MSHTPNAQSDSEPAIPAALILTDKDGHPNQHVIMALGPDPDWDDFTRMLSIAASHHDDDLVRFLTARGANPNDKANRGSSAMDKCMETVDWPRSGLRPEPRPPAPVWRVSLRPFLDCIDALGEGGAVWRPERFNPHRARKALLQCEPTATPDVLKALLRHEACTKETIVELLGTTKMREHVSGLAWHFRMLKLKSILPELMHTSRRRGVIQPRQVRKPPTPASSGQ